MFHQSFEICTFRRDPGRDAFRCDELNERRLFGIPVCLGVGHHGRFQLWHFGDNIFFGESSIHEHLHVKPHSPDRQRSGNTSNDAYDV
jgi:hypothetical protein